jgi:hypothetical protein
MVGTAECAGQAGGGEGQRQDLPIKGAYLGAGGAQRPGAALDLGQCLEDFGPCAAQYFHVA